MIVLIFEYFQHRYLTRLRVCFVQILTKSIHYTTPEVPGDSLLVMSRRNNCGFGRVEIMRARLKISLVDCRREAATVLPD